MAKIGKIISREGYVKDLNIKNYKTCIFKLWNAKRKTLTICGIKNLEWVNTYYEWHNVELVYIRPDTKQLVIIADL